MRAVARITLLVLGGGLSAVPLRAQGSWVPPQPPCELPPPPSKVKDGMQALRGAVEKPELREQQLGQARKLLTEAIAQDNQGANAGAWYYLGRYYVETGDVPGADSALTRAAGLAPKCGDDIATYRSEEHTSELQSRGHLVCRLLLEKKKQWDEQDLNRQRVEKMIAEATEGHGVLI